MVVHMLGGVLTVVVVNATVMCVVVVGHVVLMGIQVFNRTDDHVIGIRDKPSGGLDRLPGNDHAQQNEQGTSPHGCCVSY